MLPLVASQFVFFLSWNLTKFKKKKAQKTNRNNILVVARQILPTPQFKPMTFFVDHNKHLYI